MGQEQNKQIYERPVIRLFETQVMAIICQSSQNLNVPNGTGYNYEQW